MSPHAVLRILLVGILLLGSVGCKSKPSFQEKASSVDSEKEITKKHWLFVHIIDFTGNYKLTVNGFPVEREPVNVTMSDQDIGARLNTALIGKLNTASVIVEPYLQRSGDKLLIGEASLEAEVSREAKGGSYVPLREAKGISRAEVDSAYTRWKKRALKKWEEYLEWEKHWLRKHPDSSESLTPKEGGALDSIEAWSDQNPLKVKTTFDNEAGPDFSRVFEEAPRLPDTPATRERLRGYAMQLREIISNRDGSGLYREIRPAKNAAYRKQGKTPPPDSVRRSQWAGAAEDKIGWFRDVGEKTTFGRDQIGLRPWVGGRVWELYRKPGDPLFGGWKIYVSEIDGELKVVRLE